MVSYTKIDVAEAHIRTAVRLFFEDAHPIPVYTLASAAREIMTTLGVKLGIDTVLHDYARARGADFQDATRKAHAYAGFMKHADRDATKTLDGFSDLSNDFVLFLACHDFGRVTGGMPIEAQVFEVWYFATQIKKVSKSPPKRQELIKACIRQFPGVRSVGRAAQKEMGLRVLKLALTDASLKMQIKRTVELPIKSGQPYAL